MASKKYKNKPCCYCGCPASTQEHVLPREFFFFFKRNELISVPACEKCNNDKSAYDNYATTVIPFGGRHEGSCQSLLSVKSRLNRNNKLYTELRSGACYSRSGNLCIPFSDYTMQKLCDYLAKGISYYHLNEELSEKYLFNAFAYSYINRNNIMYFYELFGQDSDFDFCRDLADSHFQYRCSIGFCENDGTRAVLCVFQFLEGSAFTDTLENLNDISTCFAVAGKSIPVTIRA